MAAPLAHGPAGRDEDPDRQDLEPEGLVEYEAAAWKPVVTRPDPMSQEEQQALLDAVTDDDAPWWSKAHGGPVAGGSRCADRRRAGANRRQVPL